MLGSVNTKESWSASAKLIARTTPEALSSVSSFQRAVLRRRGISHNRSTLRSTWRRCELLFEEVKDDYL